MNRKKEIDILKKVYHHSNSDYDSDYFGQVGYKTDFLTSVQFQLLKQANLVPNNFEKLTHDSLLAKLLEIKESGLPSLDFCTSLFIKGLSGEYPRYRQSLLSYWYVCGLSNHSYQKSETSATCIICGLPESTVEDRTYSLLSYHMGNSWNEQPEYFLAELQEISAEPKPELNEEDIQRFIQLLQEINNADKDETPADLEKRIAKSKLLPKTDKFKRYGIFQTLAVLGILPSKSEFDNQPEQSDIVFPLAGWKGELGVDFNKAKEIFQIEILPQE